jgi:hypothetical protein
MGILLGILTYFSDNLDPKNSQKTLLSSQISRYEFYTMTKV